MAINFPNSPNLNDTFKFGSKFYKWNGTAWSPENNTSSIKPVEYTNLVNQTANTISIDPTVNNYFRIDSTDQAIAIDIPSASPHTSFMLELDVAHNISVLPASAITNTVISNIYDSAPSGLYFNPDGTKMFTIGSTNDRVLSYNLSTPFDLSTATYQTFYSLSAQTTVAISIAFNDSGSYMFILGTSRLLYRYSMTTPFDITGTVSYQSVVTLPGGTTSGYGYYDPSDIFAYGNHIYHVNTGRFFSSVPPIVVDLNSIGTGVYGTFNPVAQIGWATQASVRLSSDGRKMFLHGSGIIYQYTLTTPYFVSSAVYDNISTNITSLYPANPSATAFHIPNNNSDLFIHSGAYLTIDQVNLDNPLSPVITWSNNIQWAGGYAPSLSYEYKSLTILINFITYDGINWIADIITKDIRV